MAMATSMKRTFGTAGGIERVDIWWTTNSSGYASCNVELHGSLVRVLTATGHADSAPTGYTALSAAGSYDVTLLEADGSIDVFEGLVMDRQRGSTEQVYVLPDGTSSLQEGIPVVGLYSFHLSDGFWESQGADYAAGATGVVRIFLTNAR